MGAAPDDAPYQSSFLVCYPVVACSVRHAHEAAGGVHWQQAVVWRAQRGGGRPYRVLLFS